MATENKEWSPPRPIENITGDYNKICAADELVIDQMIEYEPKKIPKMLLRQHKLFKAMLRELDQERNYAIPFYHNVYRLHYAQAYPKILSRSMAKQIKESHQS